MTQINSKVPLSSSGEHITVQTTIANGIPDTFTKQMSSSRSYNIQKGQHNEYRQRPMILNEHVESKRELQAVVTSGACIGQIFKASQDNINGLWCCLESASGVNFDDFESYADDAALQAAWVANSARLATLDAAVAGGQGMVVPGTNVADSWTRTITATDYSEYTFDFDFSQSNSYGQLKFRFFIGDGTNTKSFPIIIVNPNELEHFEIQEQAMIEDGGGTTDVANITKVGFIVEDQRTGSTAFVDDLVFVPAPGLVEFQLWDCGSTLPVDGVFKLNDGNQYTTLGDAGFGTISASKTLELVGGKRVYTVFDFVAGVAEEIPTNVKITPGNYYAILMCYVDTNVNVYGPDTSYATDYYTNGYSFIAVDADTPIVAIGQYSDLMFGIFSTQDVWVNTLLKFYDAEPGLDATEFVIIEDKNMNIENVVAGENRPQQSLLAEFDDRFFELPKGGKFEVHHNDDFSDQTSKATVLIGYIFEPPTING